MLVFNKYLLIELGVPNRYSFQSLTGSGRFVFDSVLSFIVFLLKQVSK